MHQTFHSTQTWTIKGRTQTITSSNKPGAFPGPTNYNNEKPIKNYGTAVIGTNKRLVFESKDRNPGPGSYLEKSYISDGPKRTMSARHPIKITQMPGPTTYKPHYKETLNKQPQYTISPRKPTEWNKKDSQIQPGPNHYNPEQIEPKQSAYLSNSKRKSLSQFQKTPGPAAYQHKDNLTSRKNPITVIGSAQRKSNFDNGNNTPAPNTYNIQGFVNQQLKNKKGYSMRPKTADPFSHTKKGFPGPGNYNFAPNDSKTRGFSSGKNQRKTFIDQAMNKNKTPAPGSYKPNETKSTGFFSFSNSRRKHLSQFETTPGPAVYELSQSTNLLKSKAPGYSMGRSSKGLKQFFNTKQSTPGPTDYEPNIKSTKQSSKTFQLSKSKWLKSGKGLDAPGVGCYNLCKTQSNGWTFKKQKRSVFTQNYMSKNNPGPPQYDVRGSIPNPPKYMTTSNYKSKC